MNEGSKAENVSCEVGTGAEDMLNKEYVDKSSKAKTVDPHLGQSKPYSKQKSNTEYYPCEYEPRAEVENESW